MSRPDSGFLGALVVLARAGVDFVVVGTGGINFYASDASQTVETDDVDVFLRADVGNLGRALESLRAAGYEIEARGEPFLDSDEPILRNVIRAGASLRAIDETGARLDLMLSGGGFVFSELAADASIFRLGEVEVRVGNLARLIRSKELAGRPKDIEFLRMFAARLRPEIDPD